MKQKITMDYLASKLNMSKTTISKALNNCPGISAATKSKVLSEAEKHGYAPSRPAQRVAVILPSVPDYFWGNMRKKISAHSERLNIPCKYFVYPDMLQAEHALSCINEALSEGSSVLIVAAPETREIKAALENAANKSLIILSEQFIDIKNTFYIGENSYSQGFNLGKKYLSEQPDTKSFAVVKSTLFYTEQLRINGFFDAIKQNGAKIISEVTISSSNRTQSAFIARQLAELKELPDCIFCPSGNISQACLAIKKLKSQKEIHCIGFDINTECENPALKDIFSLAIQQDIEAQARLAAECADRFLKLSKFPDKKNIYVDGIYYSLR